MTTIEGGKSGKQAVSIVLIEANGTIKTLKTKEVTTETLYKKCGFRVSEDFHARHTWCVNLKENDTKVPYTVSVWAKKTGKANFENKYDFPPPIDNELFFGTCAIVRMAETSSGSTSNTDEPAFLDLTKESWLKIYEKLFGGFEDIGDEDEYSEDELDNVDPALLTAHGYLKDDFVVSDKESIEMVSDDTDTSPVPTPTTKKPATTTKKPTTATTTKKPTTATTTTKKPAAVKKIAKRKVQSQPQEDDDDDDSDKEDTDTSELEEEVYTFSDDD